MHTHDKNEQEFKIKRAHDEFKIGETLLHSVKNKITFEVIETLIVTVQSTSSKYYREDGFSFGLSEEEGYMHFATCTLATESEREIFIRKEQIQFAWSASNKKYEALFGKADDVVETMHCDSRAWQRIDLFVNYPLSRLTHTYARDEWHIVTNGTTFKMTYESYNDYSRYFTCIATPERKKWVEDHLKIRPIYQNLVDGILNMTDELPSSLTEGFSQMMKVNNLLTLRSMNVSRSVWRSILPV
jgi:hypothetical protein